MKIALIISICFILFAISNWDKMSYKKFEERCEINSKHPDWIPYCGINFIEKDPQWFIDHGYADVVKKYSKK